MQNRKRPPLAILILALCIALVFFLTRERRPGYSPGKAHPQSALLNRDKNRLIYSKHARCRMDCRNIDSSEVVEILEAGTVNYHKSDTTGSRDPKFALEGLTHDGQKVRLVIAMADLKTVVVTVIDLDQDIECTCP